MPLNVFERAVRQLSRRLQTDATVRIIYHRGEFFTPLSVWEGQTVFRTNTGQRTFLDWGGKDFLIISNELVINGTNIEPTEGDWIERIGPAGTIEKYELSAPTGEPVWRKSDPQGYIWRIHTKQVKYAE